ncbi:MAG: PIN domain-containing protein [Deinococcota bacterium]
MLSLIDSSAWIDFFRGREPYASLVDTVVADGNAAICGMVELELRNGIKVGETYILELLAATHRLPTREEDFTEAGTKLAQLRSKGITVPSSDGLIAQLAIRHGATLIANDAHFTQFKTFGLKQRTP